MLIFHLATYRAPAARIYVDRRVDPSASGDGSHARPYRTLGEAMDRHASTAAQSREGLLFPTRTPPDPHAAARERARLARLLRAFRWEDYHALRWLPANDYAPYHLNSCWRERAPVRSFSDWLRLRRGW